MTKEEQDFLEFIYHKEFQKNFEEWIDLMEADYAEGKLNLIENSSKMSND
ncbi:MAG: hypothetical protein PHS59_18155 [Paludibacter sp.]|nr:hypothetical protein [Paludibacter sp.]